MLIDYDLRVDEYKDNEHFKDILEKMSLVCTEYLAKYLRNHYRQRRGFTKLYHDLSLLNYLSNQVQ